VFTASPAGATYQWLLKPANSNNVQTINANGATDTVNCSPQYFGTYYVVTTVNGCADTSNGVDFVCSGISDIKSLVEFGIHPNPASDVLHVSYALNEVTHIKMAILDLTGRRITPLPDVTETSGFHSHTVSLQGLSAGVYLLNFMTDAGSFNTRFVKQ
jgi:hypothetical protein